MACSSHCPLCLTTTGASQHPPASSLAVSLSVVTVSTYLGTSQGGHGHATPWYMLLVLVQYPSWLSRHDIRCHAQKLTVAIVHSFLFFFGGTVGVLSTAKSLIRGLKMLILDGENAWPLLYLRTSYLRQTMESASPTKPIVVRNGVLDTATASNLCIMFDKDTFRLVFALRKLVRFKIYYQLLSTLRKSPAGQFG